MKILLGITGASGAPYALRLAEILEDLDGVELSCIISQGGKKIIEHEAPSEVAFMEKCYTEDEMEAPFSSGSFKTDAMVIIPCSMKTLAAVANGFASNLITRSADVMLKERRKLIIVPRETPLNSIHLENMLKLSNMGAVILPAMPAFYNRPETLDDMVDFIVGKVMDALGLENDIYNRWKGK